MLSGVGEFGSGTSPNISLRVPFACLANKSAKLREGLISSTVDSAPFSDSRYRCNF